MPEYPKEAESRRPDFAGGSPVVLAGGETWLLARPVVTFHVVDDENDCGFATHIDLGDDGRFAKAMKAYDAAVDARQWGRALGSSLHAGMMLLRRNYDLTTDQVAALMPFSNEDGTDGFRIRGEVMDVATGNGPKPEGGGGG